MRVRVIIDWLGFLAKEKFVTDRDKIYVCHGMYLCICVYVYVKVSVEQQLLQSERVKIGSSINNFGKLSKMAGVFCFLPLCLFV